MEQTHIDLEELHQRFLRENKWYPPDRGNASGKVAELYVVMAVEKMQRVICPLFLREEIRRDSFVYRSTGKASYNILVRKRGCNKPIDEIDLVVMQGNLPIIIETHISQYTAGKNGSSICDMIKEGNIKKKQENIARLLGRWPEMMVVIPENYKKKLMEERSCLRRYVYQGGHVVFFPYERHAWQEKIQQLMQRQWRRRQKEMTDAPENEYSLQATGNPHPSSLSLPSRRSYI